MKKIIASLLFCAFIGFYSQARADLYCYCGTGAAFTQWTAEWTEFTSAVRTMNLKLLGMYSSLATGTAYGGVAETTFEQEMAKQQAKVDIDLEYNRDHMNRQAEQGYDLLKKTVRQNTALHQMNLEGSDCPQYDGASVDGVNAIQGTRTSRELKDAIRTRGHLDGQSGRGGAGGNEMRKIRQEIAERYSKEKGKNSDISFDQLLPANGKTYKDPEAAKALGEILAVAMTPDPWPDPSLIKFDSDEKMKEYKAMLLMLHILKDPALDAIGSYIAHHTGTTNASVIWNLIAQSKGASAQNPQEFYPADTNGNLSMADVYRAWSEHYLSPSVANSLNSDNSASTIQQALSRLYLMMRDSEHALQNAVTILALKQSGAKKQIEDMRLSFMNAAKGSQAE